MADVYRDDERELTTDVSHDVINSAGVWDGETGTGVATRGEGVVVGVIDSGVNPDHPSFAEVAGDGYVHENPFGSGSFVGVCDPSHPQHEDLCNDKLIGAWNLHPLSPSAVDGQGHGSHTASTAAGNVHDATFTVGNDTFTRTVQRVAPRANVISYLVCFPGCPSTSAVAAVDQAIADGVDVLSYSISGADNPWNDIVDLAFLDAYEAGIFVTASAGNDGPGAGTVAHTAPWNATVAASTHFRVFGHTVDAVGPDPVPPDLSDIPAPPGDGPGLTTDIQAEVRDAALVDEGNGDGCDAFPTGVFDGAVALIERGTCTFAIKVDNASAAGAVAVVIVNNVAGPPTAPGALEDTTIPAVMVGSDQGGALRDFVVDTAPDAVTVRLNAAADEFRSDEWTDVMAGFSSRGPSQVELLAPTFTLPGVNILAAVNASGGDPAQYGVLQGTSMSSPHGAGAAALLTALHPDWSPSSLHSALASTAEPDTLVKEDGVTSADPFDQGSGRADLAEAGRIGLVMDETHANFEAADPDIGGDPKSLNLPAMVDQECIVTCTWTRTVTSVADTTATYSATSDAPAGVTVSVSPSELTLAPGATQELEITADVSGAEPEEWTFADVRLETDAVHGNGQPVAPVHYPVAVIPFPATPSAEVEPAELSSVQSPDELVDRTLDIANTGDAPLEWELVEAETTDMSTTTTATTASLWEQPSNGTGGIVSDFFNAFGVGVYSADDFSLPAAATLDSIHAEGFWNTGSLADATAINWYIYPDDGGVPAGHPEDGQDAHVFTHTAPPAGAGVDITNNNITLDLAAATGGSLDLEAGTYWLSVFPDIDDTTGDGNLRWNWSEAGSELSEAHLVDPGNLFGGGWTDWTSFSDAGLTFSGTAFRVDGQIDCTPGELPWLDLSDTGGTVAPGDHAAVTATFDSTGLGESEQDGLLCLSTNDPENPLAVIPVSLAVETMPEITVTPDELDAELFPGAAVDQTLTIGNDGNEALEWSVSQAEAEAEAATSAIAPLADVLITGDMSESFDDVTQLALDGWAMTNNSEPLGITDWFQGNPDVFPAHEGAEDAYIAANFQSASELGTISNWLLTPELTLRDGDTFSFWSRAPAGSIFPDRMEVRLSTAGESTDVGGSADSVGNFTNLLLSVNEDLALGGYPEDWTRFEVTVDGVGGPVTGRIGFRYFVTDGGPFGLNSDFIGVDEFTFTSAHPCSRPVDIPWLDVATTSGTTAPGDSSDVTVTLDSTGLDPGEYEAQLCVESDDPAEPLVTVPVSLTVREPVTCDRTLSGLQLGLLAVRDGVTCLEDATVIGAVTVDSGAGLVSEGSFVIGPVTTDDAAVVTLDDTRFIGPVTVAGTTEWVEVAGNEVTGPVTLLDNSTGDMPIVVSDNGVLGPLSCVGNEPPPVDDGVPNPVLGPKVGQCRGL